MWRSMHFENGLAVCTRVTFITILLWLLNESCGKWVDHIFCSPSWGPDARTGFWVWSCAFRLEKNINYYQTESLERLSVILNKVVPIRALHSIYRAIPSKRFLQNHKIWRERKMAILKIYELQIPTICSSTTWTALMSRWTRSIDVIFDHLTNIHG